MLVTGLVPVCGGFFDVFMVGIHADCILENINEIKACAIDSSRGLYLNLEKNEEKVQRTWVLSSVIKSICSLVMLTSVIINACLHYCTPFLFTRHDYYSR